jgi:hypothetical protein
MHLATWVAAAPNRWVMPAVKFSSPWRRPGARVSARMLRDESGYALPRSALMAKDRRGLLHGLRAGQRGGPVAPVSRPIRRDGLFRRGERQAHVSPSGARR